MHRSCESPIHGPTVAANACTDGLRRDPETGAPLRNGQGLAGICQARVIPPVVLLLSGRGPSAITRLISGGRVNAINGMTKSGGLAHVSDPILKRVPPLANSNAFGAILLVARRARFVTSPDHRLPNFVDVLFAAPMRRALSLYAGAVDLAAQAAARLRVTVPQGLPPRQGFIAAIAQAVPPRNPVFGVWSATQDQKSPESFTGQVYERWHASSIAHRPI